MPMGAAIGMPINTVRIRTGNGTQALDMLYKKWRNGCLWKRQLHIQGGVNWMSMEASIGCPWKSQSDSYRGLNWMPMEAAIWVPINKVRISTGNRTQTLDTVHKRWRNGCLWKRQLDAYRGVNWMLIEVSIGCLQRRQLYAYQGDDKNAYGGGNWIPMEADL